MVGPTAAYEPPQSVHVVRPQERARAELRAHPLGPPEVGVDQDNPFQREPGLPGPQGHAVGYVAARAVPRQEHPRGVPVGRDPPVGARGGPPQAAEAVIVGRGNRALGREAVVEGDDQDAGPGREGAEEGVVEAGEGGPGAEPAPVEVEEDGELCRRGGVSGFGQVEARPERDVRVDDDVPGGGPGRRVGSRRGVPGVVEAFDRAVLVDADDG
ncbi:tuliposide A-converting enzyme 1, chloroplastic [Iris pallida]|uniref:Tuliposide A-converting enzyme 1, chloroplastic n=1 Tax=Iris pallida TaxID=29817 RepID=A0AAX6F1Z8_IRIPA|nr:tuliposide A-converting enzyme 1, chloroplastic [Iris pallida]